MNGLALISQAAEQSLGQLFVTEQARPLLVLKGIQPDVRVEPTIEGDPQRTRSGPRGRGQVLANSAVKNLSRRTRTSLWLPWEAGLKPVEAQPARLSKTLQLVAEHFQVLNSGNADAKRLPT